MFKASHAFFSFTEVTDVSKHRDYNAWHQLDHRPENLALSGIPYGERWVSSPDCIKARLVSDPLIHNFHYMNMYWMQQPLSKTWHEFEELGSQTLALGSHRRPEMPYAKRHLTGVFMAVKGYATPRVLISPEALPFRPTRGVFATMYDLHAPGSADAQDMLQWYDEVHIPDIASCKGVAGCWSFQSLPGYSNDIALNSNPAGRRINLYYLDQDPLEMLADMRARVPAWRAAGRLRDNSKTKKDLHIGPLRTIIPWQWDWFDKA